MKTLLNRVAKSEFVLSDFLVCGVVLTGTEIKAIRAGKANLTGSYARVLTDPKSRDPELWLVGMSVENSDVAKRKLLVIKKQLAHLIGASQQKNQTLVVVKGFFQHGYFKVEIGLGKRLKKYEKRAKLREIDMDRRAARARS